VQRGAGATRRAPAGPAAARSAPRVGTQAKTQPGRKQPAHQLRPPLEWSFGWLFHTAAKPMVTEEDEPPESRSVESACKEGF
jgi:hypothetical protein